MCTRDVYIYLNNSAPYHYIYIFGQYAHSPHHRTGQHNKCIFQCFAIVLKVCPRGWIINQLMHIHFWISFTFSFTMLSCDFSILDAHIFQNGF